MTWHQWQLLYPTLSRTGLSLLPRLLERLRRPGPPVDGVVGVLEEVGGRLMGQSVRHGVHPAAGPDLSGARRVPDGDVQFVRCRCSGR